MKRRGVFGLLAGAAVAGPSMAKQAVADMSSLQLGGGGLGPVVGYANASFATDAQDGPYDPAGWVKDAMKEFMGRSAQELLEARLETHVSSLDPDIAAMRSISLDAKIRMMRDRVFERNNVAQIRYYKRELAQAAKRMLS